MPRKKTCPDNIEKICEFCNKTYKCSWNARKKQRYCNKVCSNSDPKTKEKIIKSQTETFIKNYGTHPMKMEKTRNNLKKSMLKKYGVDWGSKISGHSERIKNTMMSKYGVPYFENKKKKSENNLKKYGKENVQSVEKFKQKTKITKKHIHFKNQLLPLLKLKGLIPEFSEYEYTNSHWKTKYNFTCEKCDHRFQYSLYHKNMLFCPKCSPVGKNKPEAEIYEFLTSVLPNENIKIRDRTILSGKELDFYVPSKKFAIEHDGLYWHSEGNSDKPRHNKHSHLNKLRACAFYGVNLVRIFEDEWTYKTDVIKSIFKNHLGLFNRHLPPSYNIRELNKEEYYSFVSDNWINLSEKITSIRLGLFIEDKLISAIGLQKSKKKSGAYEIMDIIRDKDSLYDNSCINGLLGYFIKIYSPSSVLKYIDRRIEPWNNLLEFGFDVKEFSNPRWYLLVGDYKSRIYDTRTSVGDKIWDCGLIKLEWTNSTKVISP